MRVTLEQVAEYCGETPRQVQIWCDSGRLGSMGRGAQLRIPVKSLVKFLRKTGRAIPSEIERLRDNDLG